MPFKKSKIGVMLGGIIAGFIGALVAAAIVDSPTASAGPSYGSNCVETAVHPARKALPDLVNSFNIHFALMLA
jgi:hypothetical protein